MNQSNNIGVKLAAQRRMQEELGITKDQVSFVSIGVTLPTSLLIKLYNFFLHFITNVYL